MRISTLILVAIFLLSAGAYADCEIDGAWTENTYQAGETMKFEGSIEPDSGFIKVNLFNENEDIVASLSERQITSDFEFEFDTDDSYLSGDYKIKAIYTDYANGTECDETLTSIVHLNTSNKIGDVALNLTITQNPGSTTTSLDGSPVQTPLGEFTSKIDVTGPSGWASSFYIDGTQLAPGSSLGTVDLHLTQCQKNEDILTSYTEIADFLSGDYTNVIALEQEKSRLETENSNLRGDITGLREDKLNLTGQVSEWKATANSKWDFPMPFIIGFVFAIIFIILLRKVLIKMNENEPPNQMEEDNNLDFKKNKKDEEVIVHG